MQKKISKSLMFQLSIILVLIITAVLGLFGVYQYHTSSERLMTELNRDIRLAADRLSISLRAPLYNFHEQGINDIIMSEMGDHTVTMIYIMERWEDKPTHVHVRREDGTVGTEDNIDEFLQESHISETREIVYDEYELGEVHIYVTRQYMQESLFNILITTMMEILLVDIILITLIITLLRVKVIRPITYLKSALLKVAKGQLDTKITVSSSNEVGDLAIAFRQMTGDLKKSKAELEGYSTGLEKKVEEKTKELESKVGQLEKFNKFSVDRELRMVELKKKIKELEGELNKKR